MRNPPLHDALRAFSIEAARLLTRDLEDGAELPFEVAEERGAVSPLYRYRPLTGRFIAVRWLSLRALASCAPAEAALGTGAAPYLRRLGARGADAEPALQAMLERLWEDLTSFAFPEERFERVYAELERALYAGVMRTTVVAPVYGLVLEDDAGADLGDGLTLVPASGADAPAGAGGDVHCRMERVLEDGHEAPVDEAVARVRGLLSGLRLLGAGGVSVGPIAYSRVDESPWQAVSLGTPAFGRGDEWRLAPAEVAELRELVGLLAAPGWGGAVRWAHGRFELACDRARDAEALTDLLLALGALLDGHDDVGRASLPLRVAALCAEEGARRGVQRRVELAFALERFVVDGGGAGSYVDVIGSESPARLVAEVEEHVRGLLRDVLCGYLAPELARAADDILLRSAEPLDIRAHDTRDLAAPGPPPRGTRAGDAADLDLDGPATPAGDAADLDLDPAGPAGPDEREPRGSDLDPAGAPPEAEAAGAPEPHGSGGGRAQPPAPPPPRAPDPASHPAPPTDPGGSVAAPRPAPPREDAPPGLASDRGWVATAGLRRPPSAETLADWDFDD